MSNDLDNYKHCNFYCKMSSNKKRKRGRGGRTKNTEQYRWNAVVLGKSSSNDSNESMDIDEKFDSTKFRPWNAAALNKSNIENESSVSIFFTA